VDLNSIKNPDFIKDLSVNEMKELAKDLRYFLIDNVSKTGGHLSSNLGVVELTIALLYVFAAEKDKIFFDVGHQSYVYKILTGRGDRFSTLRQWKGLSGFQKREESSYDVWEAGHSSTSLSAALGMAIARDLDQLDYDIVPIIGDGSIGSGMSFEALNHIGSSGKKVIVILNDNNMSISSNVGAVTQRLERLRSSKGYNVVKQEVKDVLSHNTVGEKVLGGLTNVRDYIKRTVFDSTLFDELGFRYFGPVDGHNFKELIRVFNIAKKVEHPVVIHVVTKKGKGYSFCEEDRNGYWHGVSSFNPETGVSLSTLPYGHLSWSECISETLVRLAKENQDIIGITPAMITGSKLEKFQALFPDRFFDCGIAEEHATTFAAALALEGKRPFLAIYSSFLQRAYDQVNHDICRMNLPVVIGVDRSGIVGEDGETHQGVFDISFLAAIPNIIIAQPKNAIEAQNLLYTAFQQKSPFALRFSRGSIPFEEVAQFESYEIGKWEVISPKKEPQAIIICYGGEVDKYEQKIVSNELPIILVNARFIKPLDSEALNNLATLQIPIYTVENEMLHGGLSSMILEYYNDHNLTVDIHRYGIDDVFLPHGSIQQLRKHYNLNSNDILEEILSQLKK
jgi:1-deoxy-D-xylulose-5-phosphate synthase